MTESPDIPSETPDEQLVQLIAAAIDASERGDAVDVDELCQDHPEHRAAVIQALALNPEFNTLHQRARDHDPICGQTLVGRYELVELIGAGAMGRVYRSVDKQLDRRVAVKLLHRDLGTNGEAESRFAREARTLAALKHPNIVAVYDFGRTEDDVAFLVLEPIDGESSSHLVETAAGAIDRGTLSDEWLDEHFVIDALPDRNYLRLAVGWIADVAKGLQAAHDAGVVHRDIKPSNILVRVDGHPVLVDFGIAARDAEATLSSGDNPIGTPAYMAPESLRGNRASVAIDIYGLTATLYHFCTFTPPYQGSATEVLHALARRDPIRASERRPGLPRDLQAILDCGMSREPQHRYPSARALENDLRAFLAYQPVSVRPVSRLSRMVRRVLRSREFRAGAAVLIVGLALLGFAEWQANDSLDRSSRFHQLWATLPTDLGLVGSPGDRALPDPRERRFIAATLDAAVGLRPDRVEGRRARAAFRRDHGDTLGAIEDMNAIAESVGTPFALALAASHERNSSAGPIDNLEWATWPEPATHDGRYLFAFERLRSSKPEAFAKTLVESFDTLQPGIEAGHLPSLELGGFCGLAAGKVIHRTNRESTEPFRRVMQIAQKISIARSRPTALSQFLYGAALAYQSLYAEALPYLEESLHICEFAHPARMNLAVVLRRQLDPEGAKRQLEIALSHRPDSRQARLTLAQLRAQFGELDGAHELFDTVEFDETPSARRYQAYFRGLLYRYACNDALREGDIDGARRAAQQAIPHLETAAKLGHSAAPALIVALAPLSEGDGDDEQMVRLLLEELRSDPLNGALIDNVVHRLPATFDTRTAAATKDFLRSLIQAIAARPGSSGAPQNTPGLRNQKRK